jgi:hypothetical protein
MAPVDVVGSSPISFTNANGGQQVVPLSALELSGSTLQIASAWTTVLDAGEQATLLAVAQAQLAIGELQPPPTPPPTPAIALTAARTGKETNNIVVAATTEKGKPPLEAAITFSATETDTWAGLADGPAAAQAIGVDAPTGKDGDPPGGTGLVVVKQGSTGASAKPAVASSGKLTKATGVDLKDADSKTVLTLQPRTDYAGKDGLSYKVTVDSGGKSFTVTATYDSTKEAGTQDPVTVQTLGNLPAQVGYLVKASGPPAGPVPPADSSVQLSRGADGLAASGLLYA